MNALDTYGAALDAAERVGGGAQSPDDARPIFEAALDAIPERIADDEVRDWTFLYGVTFVLASLLNQTAQGRSDVAGVKALAAQLDAMRDRLPRTCLRETSPRPSAAWSYFMADPKEGT